MFTVGYSPTRGVDGVVCWNGIHHKTTANPVGAAKYGYPDDTYLARVKDELRQKDVFFESEDERDEAIAKAIKLTQVQTEEL